MMPRPSTPARRWPIIMAACTGSILGGAGAYLAISLRMCPVFETSKPREITALESEPFVQETEPRSIVLHFLDPAEIHRRSSPTARAFTMPHAHPCEVFLPTGMKIAALPGKAEAYFVRTADASVVAQMILHCFRGQRHPGGS